MSRRKTWLRFRLPVTALPGSQLEVVLVSTGSDTGSANAIDTGVIEMGYKKLVKKNKKNNNK